MKRIICLLLASLLFTGLRSAKTSPDHVIKTEIKEEALQPSVQQMQAFSLLSVKELEQLWGKKLSLKEKIGWWVLKKQLKRQKSGEEVPDKKPNDYASLGFAFALLGLLVFPLFIIGGFIYSHKALKAEREKPGTLTKTNKGRAKTARTISIVATVLWIFVIGIIALLAAAYNH